MARNPSANNRSTSRTMDFVIDEKRKVLACALILVMVFMWIRVLTGRKPGSAAGASAPTQAQPATPQAAARLTRVEVPRIPGRNDSVHKDSFRMQDRAYFRQLAAVPNTGTDTEVPVVSSNRDQEVVQQVARTLKLEAVLRSQTPRAFVNDRLLGTGDKFVVEHGAGSFEFEVLRIDDDAVLVECNGMQLTLKLAQYVDVRK